MFKSGYSFSFQYWHFKISTSHCLLHIMWLNTVANTSNDSFEEDSLNIYQVTQIVIIIVIKLKSQKEGEFLYRFLETICQIINLPDFSKVEFIVFLIDLIFFFFFLIYRNQMQQWELNWLTWWAPLINFCIAWFESTLESNVRDKKKNVRFNLIPVPTSLLHLRHYLKFYLLKKLIIFLLQSSKAHTLHKSSQYSQR